MYVKFVVSLVLTTTWEGKEKPLVPLIQANSGKVITFYFFSSTFPFCVPYKNYLTLSYIVFILIFCFIGKHISIVS